MSVIPEKQRVLKNLKGENPPAIWVVVSSECHADPKQSLNKIREIMQVIADHPADKWPPDNEWAKMLPAWFLKTFDNHTPAEIMADKNLWDFGSWLDALRLRGWEWWSSSENDSGWVINLSAYDIPYSVGPLIYLGYITNARNITIQEK